MEGFTKTIVASWFRIVEQVKNSNTGRKTENDVWILKDWIPLRRPIRTLLNTTFWLVVFKYELKTYARKFHGHNTRFESFGELHKSDHNSAKELYLPRFSMSDTSVVCRPNRNSTGSERVKTNHIIFLWKSTWHNEMCGNGSDIFARLTRHDTNSCNQHRVQIMYNQKTYQTYIIVFF